MGDSHRCLCIIATQTPDRRDLKEERCLCLLFLRDSCSSWPWWRSHGPRSRPVCGSRSVNWKTVAQEAKRAPEVGHTMTFKGLILSDLLSSARSFLLKVP